MTSLPQTYGEDVTVTRYGAGDYVNGRFEPGGASKFDIVATVMPFDPTEIKVLPEGYEGRAAIVLYTDSEEIRTAGEDDVTQADSVAWQGRTWRVFKIEYRPQLPNLAHWKVIAFEEDVG